MTHFGGVAHGDEYSKNGVNVRVTGLNVALVNHFDRTHARSYRHPVQVIGDIAKGEKCVLYASGDSKYLTTLKNFKETFK